MQESNNAVFCFLIEQKPDRNAILTILSKVLPVTETIHSFKQFVAYVQVPSFEDSKLVVEGNVDMAGFSGNVVALCLADMVKLHKTKVEEESAARKKTGHTSHQPASLLTTNTCVVIIGTREFCATVARIHMEEIVPLRLKLIEILTALCGLKKHTTRSRISHEDLFIVSVNPDDKDYITYNLCWVYEALLKASERVTSIEDRLSNADGMLPRPP